MFEIDPLDVAIWVQVGSLATIAYKLYQNKMEQWQHFSIASVAVGSVKVSDFWYWLHLVGLLYAIYLCHQVLNAKKSLSDRELYQIAHDLQAPIRNIKNLFLRLKNAELGEGEANLIDKGLNSVEQIKEMLKRWLPDRSENKKIKTVDLYFVIESVISSTTALERYALISLLTEPVAAWVKADQYELMQVVQNLLSNSSKYTPQERVPNISISLTKERKYWVCSISDNGIGINLSYREQIFADRARLDSEQQYGGSGLGLPICKRIIERYEGKIWLENSQVGCGSTFKFKLPVVALPPKEKSCE